MKIPGFISRFGPLTGRPANAPAPAQPAPGFTGGTAPVQPLPPPVFEEMPETRPDLSGIERPTLDDVLAQVLTPDFLGNEQLTPNEFMACLRSGAEMLANINDDEASAAAKAIGEALQDKEMLESCRLLLVKG